MLQAVLPTVVTSTRRSVTATASPGSAPATAMGPVTPSRFSSTHARFSGVNPSGRRKRPVKQSAVSTTKGSPAATVPMGVCSPL